MHEKVMVFVDGSNLLRAVGEAIEKDINSLKPSRDELNLCGMIVNTLWERLSKDALVGAPQSRVIRRYWFGSYQGNEEDAAKFKAILRKGNFEPILFWKPKSKGREKRVDIAIAREMLINAFNQNYSVGILVAGDEDYLDLIKDVKRYGIRVTGSFFNQSTSPKIRLAVDYFHELHVWGNGHKELVERIKSGQ